MANNSLERRDLLCARCGYDKAHYVTDRGQQVRGCLLWMTGVGMRAGNRMIDYAHYRRCLKCDHNRFITRAQNRTSKRRRR